MKQRSNLVPVETLRQWISPPWFQRCMPVVMVSEFAPRRLQPHDEHRAHARDIAYSDIILLGSKIINCHMPGAHYLEVENSR